MPEEIKMRPKRISSVLKAAANRIMILKVPKYGNSIFYALGFLGLTCLLLLLISGAVMVAFGPQWWLATTAGIFFRSVHLWSAQAFVLVIFLHILVVWSSGAFKRPRRTTWVIGSIAFFLLLIEAEFGYYLRGDFASQYRALQGADFWNGAYLGRIINTLNSAEVYGIHVVLIPIAIIALLTIHYTFVKLRGIATPYKKDVAYKIVPANHKKLFIRGAALAAIIVILAIIFPSPLVRPATISKIAGSDPAIFVQTLNAEFTRTSDTATYMDSIDPYNFDTRSIYIQQPYEKYVTATGAPDMLNNAAQLPDSVANTLLLMAKSGEYENALNNENPGIKPTYSLRFLSDTGVLDTEAASMHITTDQWGMIHEENGRIPLGAWWLAPLGALDHTILANDSNGDRDGALIFGTLMLLFILFPYIPYANKIPEKLHLAEFIWKA